MNIQACKTEFEKLGCHLYLDGEKIRFRYTGEGEPPAEAKGLLYILRECKEEVTAYLKEALPKPFLEPDGSLVIPFSSDRCYHWWAGGQSVTETMRGLMTAGP